MTGNDGNQKLLRIVLKDKCAVCWSCFCTTSEGIVEKNMPAAYHICLASCFIHRVGGCCLRWRRNRAAMILVNVSLSLSLELMLPQILPALLPSTYHPVCRQKVSHTLSVNMCHVHLTPLLSLKVFATFSSQEAAIKLWHLCCRQNVIAKLPAQFLPCKVATPFATNIRLPPFLPSNLPPTLHCPWNCHAHCRI